MKNTLMFSFHQPRLHNIGSENYQEDEFNRRHFINAVNKNPSFKANLSFSGDFLHHANKYVPQLIDLTKKLLDVSSKNNQIELISRPYNSTVAMLFKDHTYNEYIKQISTQRTLVRNLFGIDTKIFKPVSKILNYDIAETIRKLNVFEGVYADLGDYSDSIVIFENGLKGLSVNRKISEEYMKKDFQNLIEALNSGNKNYNIDVPCNHKNISSVQAYLFKISPRDEFYLGTIHEVMSDSTKLVKNVPLNKKGINSIETLSEMKKISLGLIDSYEKWELLKSMEKSYSNMKKMGKVYLKKWRKIANTDTIHSLSIPKIGGFKNKSQALYHITKELTELSVKSSYQVGIVDKSKKPKGLFLTPEIAKISRDYGELAPQLRLGIAGLGIFARNLTEGLASIGFDMNIAFPNLPLKFQKELGCTAEELAMDFLHLNHNKIHLLNSSKFENKRSIYEGDPVENIFAYNRAVKNQMLIERVLGATKGHAILHSNDNIPTLSLMYAATLNAIAKKQGKPEIGLLHTIHNVHELKLNPFELEKLGISREKMYFIDDKVATQVSAVMNASFVNSVSKNWVDEIRRRAFNLISKNLSYEFNVKYKYGLADGTINCPSLDTFPENTLYLNDKYLSKNLPEIKKYFRSFGTNDDIVKIKQNALIGYQKYSSTLKQDKNANLFVYCGRGDKIQKNIDWIIRAGQELGEEFKNSDNPFQLAIVSNSVFNAYDPEKPEIPGEKFNPQHLKEIAENSNGTIHYAPFTNQEEMLSHAAGNVGIGPSNYEPGGQNDVMALIYGMIPIFSKTGGYIDKIEELRLKSLGATHDHGNGFLHEKNYNDFKNALRKGYQLITYFKNHPEEYNSNLSRIMKESRENFSIEKMANTYVEYYEKILRNM